MKNAKSAFPWDKKKEPQSAINVEVSKVPKTAHNEDAMKMQPSWRFSMVQSVHPYGWQDLDHSLGAQILNTLIECEGKTWKELLIDDNYRNHHMECWKLCKDARDRLEELGLDDLERLVSLRLGSLERIWGILDHNVFHLLWWDPEHLVYPVAKKHT